MRPATMKLCRRLAPDLAWITPSSYSLFVSAARSIRRYSSGLTRYSGIDAITDILPANAVPSASSRPRPGRGGGQAPRRAVRAGDAVDQGEEPQLLAGGRAGGGVERRAPSATIAFTPKRMTSYRGHGRQIHAHSDRRPLQRPRRRR